MEEFTYTAKKMGVDVSISIVTESKDDANRLAGRALARIDEYETRFSRFLPDSELSQLNINGSAVVSSEFMTVLDRALILNQETRGVYNPLMQIKKFGYNQTYTDLLPDPPDKTTPYNINIEELSVSRNTNTVVLASGQQLDFGGFLKGYLAELITTELANMEIPYQGMIVNLGGDLSTIGLDENKLPFVFEVYNPITKTSIPLLLNDTCLATSGTYKRTWTFEGHQQHHILDHTGTKNPDTTIVSASVACTDGARAEGYTKMLLCKPELATSDNLSDPRLTFLLITETGEVLSS